MADIDLIRESLEHAQLRRDSMLSFVKTAVGQRIQFHKDITGLSVLVLGGVVALFNVTSDNLVKTSWLLYASGGILIITLILSMIIRIQLLQHSQNMVATMETWLNNISVAVKELRGLMVQTDPVVTEGQKAIAINNLIKAESTLDLPQLGSLAEHGHKITVGLFILSLLAIASSLLVYIT